MDLEISQAVETAILYLQDIPAAQASQVIAAWINNLVTVAEPQIVAFPGRKTQSNWLICFMLKTLLKKYLQKSMIRSWKFLQPIIFTI